jgi:transposase-like protein
MAKRKRYPEEFKIAAMQAMPTRGERTVEDLPRSLGVNANQRYLRRHGGRRRPLFA